MQTLDHDNPEMPSVQNRENRDDLEPAQAGSRGQSAAEAGKGIEMPKVVGRERKPGKRTPSGQLSREGRSAADAIAPSMLGLLKNEVVRSLQNPLWGTQIGIMHLKGEISVFQLEAGKRWANLVRRYQAALGVKGIKPVSLERVGASCDYDPDSDEGRRLTATEKHICEDFEEALVALNEAGRAAVFTVRLLCEDDKPLSWTQKTDAKCGLESLCEHWGLTKAGPQRRK